MTTARASKSHHPLVARFNSRHPESNHATTNLAFESVADIYTDDGHVEGLDADEIDALCDKINLGAD